MLIEEKVQKERIIEEKQRVIEEKQRVIEGMERIIEGKDDMIEEKERIVEGMERIIEGKDDMIVGLRESSDIAKALTDVQKPKPVQKWGERIHVFRFLTCHDILQAQ